MENHALPITEIDLLEIIPGRGLHIRTRQESWLISLPEELQSDELLRAITSGEVNACRGPAIRSSNRPNPRNKRAGATRIANETVIRSRTIYQALVAPSGLHHLGFVHPKDQSAEPGAVPAAAIGALTMPQDMFRARFFRESLCRLEPIPLPIARFGENSCPPGPIEPIEIEG